MYVCVYYILMLVSPLELLYMTIPYYAKPYDTALRRPRNLSGKLALVTGGDSGLGFSIALAMAKRGAEAGSLRSAFCGSKMQKKHPQKWWVYHRVYHMKPTGWLF